MTDFALSELQAAVGHIPGFQVAGVACGLKKNGKLDFALIASDRPCVAAGVFTTNFVRAAPVLVDMEHLQQNPANIRAVAVNTGCANACTGQQGVDNAVQTAQWVAESLKLTQNQVLVMSTGVIGTQLPMDKIRLGIDMAVSSLGDDWASTAAAIMTTDTRPKMASVEVTVAGGARYHIAGISKGAGMIAPNMATMLSVIVTDAGLTVDDAQRSLKDAAEMSFNRIVVDGDMSTNDTVLLLANGASGVALESPDDLSQFEDALEEVCCKLAQDIVRDGEGVTKFITINVSGAPDNHAAHRIANTIATSPLVKTAFFGNDANWGRIVAAAGRAGVTLKPELMKLWMTPGEVYSVNVDSLLLVDGGTPTAYSEAQATDIIRQPSVSIVLDCGLGDGSAVVWTCDLSHDYVTINGDYRS